jgi:hypothetical protein
MTQSKLFFQIFGRFVAGSEAYPSVGPNPFSIIYYSFNRALLTNRRCWLALDQILREQGLPRGGLDYLRDGCLEENVLQRVIEMGSSSNEDGEDGTIIK